MPFIGMKIHDSYELVAAPIASPNDYHLHSSEVLDSDQDPNLRLPFQTIPPSFDVKLTSKKIRTSSRVEGNGSKF